MGFFKPDIKKLRKTGNIKGLLKALSYKEALIRTEAVDAVGEIFEGNSRSPSKDKAVPILTKMLEDSDLDVRQRTVYALGFMGQERPLLKILKNGEKSLRITAAEVVGRISHNVAASDALIEALREDKDDIVRSNAAVSIGRIIEYRQRQYELYNYDTDNRIVDLCYDALVKALGDTPSVHSNVLWALAKSKRASAIPYLINGLGSECPDVRMQAAVGLGIVGADIGSEGINSLVRTAKDSEESKEIRECAILSLGSVQTATALQELRNMSESHIASEFNESLKYAIERYPLSATMTSVMQQEQMGQYWAYLHKHGKIQVKEWYKGNTYLSDAKTSPNVKYFLEEPFEAASIEEAEIIATELLNREYE